MPPFIGDLVGGLFGIDEVKSSGAFNKKKMKSLGKNYADFLLERLNAPIEDDPYYNAGADIIRDMFTRETAAGRQRIGDTATVGDFLDGGAVKKEEAMMVGASTSNYAQQLNQLVMAVEDRRERNILPYLSGGSQESMSVQGMNLQSQMGIMNTVSNFASMGWKATADGATGKLTGDNMTTET